jgi:hypothetical protein
MGRIVRVALGPSRVTRVGVGGVLLRTTPQAHTITARMHKQHATMAIPVPTMMRPVRLDLDSSKASPPWLECGYYTMRRASRVEQSNR